MKMKNVVALRHDPAPITCLYGGTASGKTYTALEWCIATALRAMIEGRTFMACVCRRTYPELRMACWDVAVRMCNNLGILSLPNVSVRLAPHPRILFGSDAAIDFKNACRPEEIKGAEYDVWVLDEVTDIPRDFYRETLIRVPRGSSRRFLDSPRHILTWNPTSRGSWVYEEFFGVEPREGVKIVQSTYKDNPHVSPHLVEQLAEWKTTDPRRWQVYGLGDWGSPDEIIYPNWRVAEDEEIPPASRPYDCVGIDFGTANPTAVVGVWIEGQRIIVDERLYQTGLSSADICAWVNETPEVHGMPIYCDPAGKITIPDLRRLGLPVREANNSVTDGIYWMQGHEFLLTPRSVNVKREIAGYCWMKDANGVLTDKPVKVLDHAMDALRYAAFSYHAEGRDQLRGRVRVRGIFG